MIWGLLGLRIGFNTQPPEGGWTGYLEMMTLDDAVSTHSRPKAAGNVGFAGQVPLVLCFNTQPPEGGWSLYGELCVTDFMFQHTAARRRLAKSEKQGEVRPGFQHTAARRRLGIEPYLKQYAKHVSTHSRPKAAGAFLKSLAPSGFAAPISLSSREKREREYNTAFSVTPAFAIS